MIASGLFRFFIGAALALSALGAAAADPALPAGLSAPSKATQLPAFSLATPDGGTVKAADYKGRILIARFWATW